jgi:hypothetical protein
MMLLCCCSCRSYTLPVLFPDNTYKFYDMFMVITSSGVLALHHLPRQMYIDLAAAWAALRPQQQQKALWQFPSGMGLSSDSFDSSYFSASIIACDAKTPLLRLQHMQTPQNGRR